MAVLVGVFGVGLWSLFLWADYKRELRSAEAYGDASLDAVAEHIKRVVGTSELLLQQLLRMLAEDGIEAYRRNGAEWQKLHDLANLPQHSAILAVFDAAGRTLVTTRAFGEEVPAFNAAAHPFFEAHRNRTVSGLLIGPTLFHPVDGLPYLIFSRSWAEDENRAFQGVVMAAVRADEFFRFAAKLLFGPKSSLSVIRDDGLVLVRQPLTPEVVQTRLDHYELFTEHLGRAARGGYEARSPVDDEPRLVRYRQLEDLPLVVVTGLAKQEVLSDWWRHAYQTGGLMLLGMMALAVVTLFGSRHAAREEHAQRELAASREQERLLMAELSHRSRNLLTLVQSLVRQLAHTSADKQALEEGLSSRLQALAKAHDLLSAEKWLAVDFRDLVEREVRPFEEARHIRLEGENVRIPAKVALTIGMAVHELATNAAKHGALSTPDGRLEVIWRLHGSDHPALHVSWIETGGPPVSKPERKGFGTSLLEHSLVYALDGTLALDFRAEGLRAEMTIRLDGGG
jgi:two-component sensor histidine kinase